jgi:hypothetical protein
LALNTLPIYYDGREYTLGGIKYKGGYGLVLILDALGIKYVWKTKNLVDVLDDWTRVYNIFQDSLGDLIDAHMFAFSDTFIISVRCPEGLYYQPLSFVNLVCHAIIPETICGHSACPTVWPYLLLQSCIQFLYESKHPTPTQILHAMIWKFDVTCQVAQ